MCPHPLAFGVLALTSLHFHPSSLCSPSAFPVVKSLLSRISDVFLPGELPCPGASIWGAPPGWILWSALETFPWPQCLNPSPSMHCLSMYAHHHLLRHAVYFLQLEETQIGVSYYLSSLWAYRFLRMKITLVSFTIDTPAPSWPLPFVWCSAPTVLWLNKCRLLRTPGFPKLCQAVLYLAHLGSVVTTQAFPVAEGNRAVVAFLRHMKDQNKKVANLKHNQQLEKKKNAQLLEEVRRREDSLADNSQHLQVSPCLAPCYLDVQRQAVCCCNQCCRNMCTAMVGCTWPWVRH